MSIEIFKDALLRINHMDSEYETVEMAADIAGSALVEAAKTQAAPATVSPDGDWQKVIIGAKVLRNYTSVSTNQIKMIDDIIAICQRNLGKGKE